MTTVARVRRGALALPEVEERTSRGAASFQVRSKGFASVTADGTELQVRLPADRADELVAALDGAAPVRRGGTTVGVAVPIAPLDVRVLDRVLRQAWEAAAPKRLVADHRPDAPARATSDLPSIGRPATAALALEGITTLDQVAARTEAELADLHGVGPKAIRILRDALAAQGRAFRAG